MKTKIILISLLASLSVSAQYETNFYQIPDKTPSMGTNAWAHPGTPGDYYWNGMRTAIVMGFLCLLIGAGVRHWARD